jgi:type VI secretion system protein ImpF
MSDLAICDAMKYFEPGLFDKLFQDGSREGGHALRRLSVEGLKEAVAGDVEALLNARMAFPDKLLDKYPECRRSVLTFGIPDFSGLSLASDDDRARICTSLEQAITRHERRLSSVTVALQVNPNATAVLYFTISAALDTGAAREPVSFDAALQPATLRYSVRKGWGKGAAA